MSNDDSSIIIRIFASNGCKRCKMFKEECQKFSLPHVVINANEEKNQEICDKYEVNQLPHIQIMRERSEMVMLEYAGYIHPISFLNTFKKRIAAKSKDVETAKVSRIPGGEITKKPGCGSCQKAKKDKAVSADASPLRNIPPSPRSASPVPLPPPSKKQKGRPSCDQKKKK